MGLSRGVTRSTRAALARAIGSEGGASGGGAAVLDIRAHVGTSTSPTSETTKAVTGVGFEPKVILPFGCYQTANSNTTHASLTLGATDGSSQASVSASSLNGVTTSDTDRRHSNTKSYSEISAGITTLESEFDSFNADGFTFDWTDADASARILNHIALGGADLEVRLTQHQMNGTNAPQSFAHGLTGGAPTALLFFGVCFVSAPPITTTHANLHISGWSVESQFSAAVRSSNGQSTALTRRTLRNDAVCVRIGTVPERSFAVQSVDASNVNALYIDTLSTSQDRFYMLAIRGAKAQVGTFDCNGSLDPLTIATPGITPKLFMPVFLPSGVDGIGTVQNGLAMTIAASDGTNHTSCGITDQNGVTTTNARRYRDSTGLSEYDFDGTLEFDATASFDGESVILDPSVNTGTGWGQGGYLILGS